MQSLPRRGSRKRIKRILAKLQLYEVGISFKIKHQRGALIYTIGAKHGENTCWTDVHGAVPELMLINLALVLAADAVHMSGTNQPTRTDSKLTLHPTGDGAVA